MTATALTIDQQIALANMSRLQAAQLQAVNLQGYLSAISDLSKVLGSMSQDTSQQLATANTNVSNLQVGAGPGLTNDFGAYSAIDQVLRTERFAGKQAAIIFIQANPTCAETDAAAAWTTAALAATGLPQIIVPPASYFILYSANLLSDGLIKDTTWASFAAWVVATPAATIMAD